MLCFAIACTVHAFDVTLAWDANTEPDLAGYKIYWGTASGSYDNSVDVGNVTQYELKGLADKTLFYFAATAYDTDGNESDYSREIYYGTNVSDVLNLGKVPQE
jgi:hypothetical protein